MNNIFDWPFFALCDDILPKISNLSKINKSMAIATLVNCEGSSPRPVGSQMLVSEDKEAWGYVSGGCIESSVVELADEAIQKNESKFVTFGFGSPYMDIKLLCGKKIDVAIDVIRPNDNAVKKLLEFNLERKPCFWYADINTSKHFCVNSIEEADVPKDVKDEMVSKKTGFSQNYYWKSYVPKLRLIINGNNPISVALIILSKQIGWEVLINKEHASDFPQNIEVDYFTKLSGEKLFMEFPLDESTAVVSLTHDIDDDHDIIKHALPSKAFYVGVLGSRKHIPKRQRLLRQDNISSEYIDQLKAPIGININSATANEIAISIIGEIIQSFRKQG